MDCSVRLRQLAQYLCSLRKSAFFALRMRTVDVRALQSLHWPM